MKNLTSNVDKQLLDEKRKHRIWIEKLLNQSEQDLVIQPVQNETNPFEGMLELADNMQLRSNAGPLSREEAHKRASDHNRHPRSFRQVE